MIDSFNIKVNNSEYESAIQRVIELNKELKNTLDNTKKSLESTNKEFESAIDRAEKFSKVVNKINNNNKSYTINNSNNSNNKKNNTNNKDDESNDKVREQNYVKLNDTFKNFSNTFSKITSSKFNYKDIPKVITNLESMNSLMGTLGYSSAAAVTALGALALALTAAAIAGSKSHKTTLEIQQSLQQLGYTYSDIGTRSINTSNKLNSINAKFENFSIEFLDNFEGFYNSLIDISYDFVSGIQVIGDKIAEFDNKLASKIAELRGVDYVPIGSSGENNKYNEIDRRADALDISKTDYASLIASIVSGSRGMGFSLKDLEEMAETTLTKASVIGKQTGQSTADVASKIASAWQNGDDSASEFGVVVSDSVLAGWAALEKGMDIVNIQYSEATMQALRYEMTMKQLSNTNKTDLQESIKLWKQQGDLIEKNKNNVSSFEEVLKISGYNNIIPEISGENISNIDEIKNGLGFSADAANSLIDSLNGVNSELNNIGDKNIDVNADLKQGDNLKAFISWWDNPPDLTLTIEEAKLKEQFNSLKEYFGKTGTETGGIMAQAFNDKFLSEVGSATSILMQRLNSTINSGVTSVLPKIQITDNATGSFYKSVKTNTTGAFNSDNNEEDKNLFESAFDYLMNPIGGTVEMTMDFLGFDDNNKKSNDTKWLNSLQGHETGGISTRAHIAAISENNKSEAIIPLNNNAANPAYEQMGKSIYNAMSDLGDIGGQTVINVAPNSMVIGDQAGLRQLALMIEKQIELNKRDRGELSYGIKK